MKKYKTLGYFYSKTSESPEKALSLYVGCNLLRVCKQSLYKNLDQTKMWFDMDKNAGIVKKNTKPHYYRLVLEKVEGESL